MRLYKALGRRTNGVTRPQKDSSNSATTVIKAANKDKPSAFPGIDDFIQKYPAFNEDHFLSGAKNAFKLIIRAFSESDLNTLKPLLSEEVYNEFKTVIDERNKREDVCFSKFVGDIDVSIVDALVQENEYKITLEFRSKQINTTHDKDRNLIDGNPDIAFDSLDIWSFCKKIGSTNENWYLVETREGDF